MVPQERQVDLHYYERKVPSLTYLIIRIRKNSGKDSKKADDITQQ